MEIKVLSYRDFILISVVKNHRFELKFTKTYSTKKVSKLDYFLSSLSLFNIFGFVYGESSSSLPSR